MNRDQLHAYLEKWDAEFNARQTRRVNTRSIGAVKPRTATQVLERLRHIVRGTPQVVVRISGGGRGMARIRAHLHYISRHGQLALEDQDGEQHLGKQDLAWLEYEWQAGGVPIAEESARREAVNIVLSMPAGTDAHALQRAAREFAAQEFAGHQYAMALHTHEHDPSRHAAPQPHLHLCVKSSGIDGRRLNPRKDDLRRWRERFAERLREHGIDAAASGRLERFQPQRGKPQAEYHLRRRSVFQRQDPFSDAIARREPISVQEHWMRERYAALRDQLEVSEDAVHRALGDAVGKLSQRERGIQRKPGRER